MSRVNKTVKRSYNGHSCSLIRGLFERNLRFYHTHTNAVLITFLPSRISLIVLQTDFLQTIINSIQNKPYSQNVLDILRVKVESEDKLQFFLLICTIGFLVILWYVSMGKERNRRKTTVKIRKNFAYYTWSHFEW